MKRIVLLVCGMLFLVANTAEARRNRPRNRGTYTPAVRVAPVTYAARPAQPAQANTAKQSTATKPVQATTAVHSTRTAKPVQATAATFSTRTAQGVANIMASSGRVGHWGGNPGYEGCGSGMTPQAAYNNCCYSNSGMATVDVGYARGANGMWYCCRRYR